MTEQEKAEQEKTEQDKVRELKALKPALKAELDALAGRPPLLLELTAVNGWVLFAAIQLSLRHPANTGPTSAGMRVFAEELLRRLRPGPALARLAALGWEAGYDVPAGEEDRG